MIPFSDRFRYDSLFLPHSTIYDFPVIFETLDTYQFGFIPSQGLLSSNWSDFTSQLSWKLFVAFLDLFCTPIPHSTEHSLQVLHGPKQYSTLYKLSFYISYLVKFNHYILPQIKNVYLIIQKEVYYCVY